jgi:hypothetical protein
MNSPCPISLAHDQYQHSLESADKAWESFKRENPLHEFESAAVAAILNDGLSAYLTTEGLFAQDRLTLFAVCPDLLPLDYADNQHVRDSNTLRDEIREEVRHMCIHLREKRYQS